MTHGLFHRRKLKHQFAYFRPEGTPRKEDNASDRNSPNADVDLWEEHFDDVCTMVHIVGVDTHVLLRRRPIATQQHVSVSELIKLSLWIHRACMRFDVVTM